jgi:hypothetical protein
MLERKTTAKAGAALGGSKMTSSEGDGILDQHEGVSQFTSAEEHPGEEKSHCITSALQRALQAIKIRKILNSARG